MLGTSEIVKYGMIGAGIFIMISSFWYHSVRRLTVNLAVVWEILGAVLIIAGIFPVLSSWTHHISRGTGLVMFCVGAVCLWGGFQFSLLVSRLAMKNQELAMQVSLLNQENEQIIRKMEELTDRMGQYEEKDSVRDQYTEPGGSGDGLAGNAEKTGQPGI